MRSARGTKSAPPAVVSARRSRGSRAWPAPSFHDGSGSACATARCCGQQSRDGETGDERSALHARFSARRSPSARDPTGEACDGTYHEMGRNLFAPRSMHVQTDGDVHAPRSCRGRSRRLRCLPFGHGMRHGLASSCSVRCAVAGTDHGRRQPADPPERRHQAAVAVAGRRGVLHAGARHDDPQHRGAGHRRGRWTWRRSA